MVKLNIGCGTKLIKGYINVDIFKFKGVDIQHDLNEYPYPFKENSATEIYCSHVIEHLNDPDKSLTQLYRILKEKGKLIIKVPYFGHSLAFSSWQHKHYFTISSFSLLDKKQEADWWIPVFSKVKIKVNFGRIYKYFPPTWISMLLIKIYFPLYEDTFMRILTPASELEVILIK